MGKLDQGNSLPLILGLVTVLLAIVNIVITAVILSEQTDPVINVNFKDTGSGEPTALSSEGSNAVAFDNTEITQMKIYLVQTGNNLGPVTYFDEQGNHVGFFRDLIFAVCEAAGVTCKTVIDEHSHCMINHEGIHPVLGIGLQAQYYDACIGPMISVDRVHVARFSLPFFKGLPAVFYYRAGTQFNLNDLRGMKIAFINGWTTNEKCIARNFPNSRGVPLTADQLIHVNNVRELASMVQNGTVDAGFHFYTKGILPSMKRLNLTAALTSLGPCFLAGSAIMSRMDSDFPDHWNRGFTKLVSNGGFKKLCEEAKVKHGHRGNVLCTESYAFDLSGNI